MFGIQLGVSQSIEIMLRWLNATLGMGLPTIITRGSSKMHQLFDFPDNLLGPRVERAYHAMSLNEDREDFVSLTLSIFWFVIENLAPANHQVLSNQKGQETWSDTTTGTVLAL